jgi:hypothetical protein
MMSEKVTIALMFFLTLLNLAVLLFGFKLVQLYSAIEHKRLAALIEELGHEEAQQSEQSQAADNFKSFMQGPHGPWPWPAPGDPKPKAEEEEED